MKNGDFTCEFNMPPALKSTRHGDDEVEHQLPPYAKQPAFLVDDWKACPESWMTSSGITKSFFVPVEEDKGMWLDFNGCDSKYHMAVVISIQGINPVTGQICSDFFMEQYKDKCPKHDIKFGADRFCKECGFKWPKQNYLCTTGTPRGMFWLDGFRTAEGIVRQYILTAEKMKGVAHNILGEEKVYALGMAFFLSKNPAPVVERQDHHHYHNSGYFNLMKSSGTAYYTSSSSAIGSSLNKKCFLSSVGETKGSTSFDKLSDGAEFINCCSNNSDGIVASAACLDIPIEKDIARGIKSTGAGGQSVRATPIKQTKKLEVGAGAKISQAVYDDPFELDYWRNEPAGIICVNYASEDDVVRILKAGKTTKSESKDGFLYDIPTGN